MWLLNSSIGKKLVMSISGIFLIFFLLFHLSMNVTAVFSGSAYNTICGLLGANWYAVAGTVVLAAFVVIHFLYALLLTLQNRKARGNDRYAVTARPKQVEWASQNMFVLGLIIICFLIIHFAQFWYHMMFAELAGTESAINPQDGAAFINHFFHESTLGWLWTLIYIIGFCALWFHLSHGFWSAIQTIGWDNAKWLKRWQCIATIVATLICGLFVIITIIFYVHGVSCDPASCTSALDVVNQSVVMN